MKYNIDLIQKDYDDGLSYNGLHSKYGVSLCQLWKWRTAGKLKIRSASEAAALYRKGRIFRHTQSTKNRLSLIRKEFIKNNPDKVPYLMNHSSKESYPESYFTEIFKQYNIKVEREFKLETYRLDFAVLDKKIDIEIDGNQHYDDPKIVEHDKVRNQTIEALGWKILRIRWSYYQQMTFDQKKQFIEELIKKINDFENNPATKYDLSFDRPIGVCEYCRKEFKISFKNHKFCSKSCAGKNMQKNRLRPSKDILSSEFKNKTISHIATEYKMSYTTIIKWLHRYGIREDKYLTRIGILFNSQYD